MMEKVRFYTLIILSLFAGCTYSLNPPTPVVWTTPEAQSSFEAIELGDEKKAEEVNNNSDFCESNSRYCQGKAIYPVPRTYCGTRYSTIHKGLDVASYSAGLPTNDLAIRASWRGTVVKSFMDPVTEENSAKGLGNLVVVEYRYEDIPANQRPDWLSSGESIYIRYCHLSETDQLEEDSSVDPGDMIGRVGRTGNVQGRTGYHVHMEVKSGPSESYVSYYKIQTWHNPLEVFPEICTD